MNFIFEYFNSPSEKEDEGYFAEAYVNDLCTELENFLPETQEKFSGDLEQAKEGLKDGIHNFLKDSIGNKDVKQNTEDLTKHLFTNFKNKICEYCQDQATEEKVSDVIKQKQINFNINCELSENNLQTYYFKLKKAQEMINRFKSKQIKILIIGPTQKGKTSLATLITGVNRRTFEQSKKQGSDTTSIREYVIKRNSIDLIWVDTPGLWDSRGSNQEKKNQLNIELYLEKNKDIDVILWVAKLDDVLDANQQKAIKDFGKNYQNSYKIWKKSILVFTHVNSYDIIPARYIEDNYEKLHPDSETINMQSPKIDQVRLNAWKEYTSDVSNTWKKYFSNNNNNNIDIPVNFVENISWKYDISNTGIPILFDGTPFIEDLLYNILMLIKMDKAPIAFLALASEPNKSSTSKKNIDSRKTLEISLQRSIEKTSSKNADSQKTSIPLKSNIGKTKHKSDFSDDYLTCHQKSLNNAANKIIKEKETTCCIIM